MLKPSLNELHAFIAIAEHESFRAAAKELNLGPSTLSHLIRSLESHLNVRLLHRTTRSVSLTEAGSHLLEQLKPAVRGVQDALLAVDSFRNGPHGTLRINAPEIAARLLLTEAIPRYLDTYPNCKVDLFIENEKVDIVADGFDVGVRMGYAVQPDMIAVPFDGGARFMCFASPDYIMKHGQPAHPDDLADHRCIRVRLPSGTPIKWKFVKGDEQIVLDVPGALILNHMQLNVETGVSGAGIIFTLERAARPFVEEGKLVPVLEDWSLPVDGLTLYYPGFRQIPGCLRAFIDIVKEVLPKAKAPLQREPVFSS